VNPPFHPACRLPPGVLEGHLAHVQPVEAALELGLEEPKVVVVVDRQAP